MGKLRHLHPPSGWFQAVQTRDGEALRREGQPFYQHNALHSEADPIVEIQFSDGTWMLATPADLDWAAEASNGDG